MYRERIYPSSNPFLGVKVYVFFDKMDQKYYVRLYNVKLEKNGAYSSDSMPIFVQELAQGIRFSSKKLIFLYTRILSSIENKEGPIWEVLNRHILGGNLMQQNLQIQDFKEVLAFDVSNQPEKDGIHIIAFGPLIKQPGTLSYRVVLVANETTNQFIVWNQIFPEINDLTKFSYANGHYFHVHEFEKANKQFCDKLIQNNFFVDSIYRSLAGE